MHCHSHVDESIPNHGPEVIEEVPNSKVDQVLLVLCVCISTAAWESVVKVSTHEKQE